MGVEIVREGQRPVAYIVRGTYRAGSSRFLTAASAELQLGFVVRPAGSSIPAHTHRGSPRSISTTTEVLLVRAGRVEVDIFAADRSLLASRVLEVGDLIMFAGGGHGFRMSADTELLEIKQGPFFGNDDRIRFEAEPAQRDGG